MFLAFVPAAGWRHHYLFFFFFNDTATTEIYTLSLHDALPIGSRCERFQAAIAEMSAGIDQSNAATASAAERLDRVLAGAETIMQITAKSGFETIDTKFIEAAISVAKKIETRFREAIAAGEITVEDLFDK